MLLILSETAFLRAPIKTSSNRLPDVSEKSMFENGTDLII